MTVETTGKNASPTPLGADFSASRLVGAVSDLARTIQKDPATLDQLTKLIAGETSLQECLKLSPEYIDTAYAKAYKFYQNQQYREALPLFNHILMLDARFTPALRGAAGCFQALGEHERALQYYLTLLAFNEFDFEAILCLSATLEAAGKLEAASEVLASLVATPQYQSEAPAHVKSTVSAWSARFQSLLTETNDSGLIS